MARFRKKVKNYERWILIGVVVVILATITITGVAPSQCAGADSRVDLSGEFLAAPGRRVEISGEEFARVARRYVPFFRTFGPTIRYRESHDTNRKVGEDEATWSHLMLVHAARESGYLVSDEELADGIKRLVGEGLMRSRVGDPTLLFDPKVYDRMVEEFYRGTKTDFEATLREVMLKDKFLAPVVDSARFSKTFEEAYEEWKTSRERVDLAYVGVPAAPFEARAGVEEETRSALAEQERVLREVGTAAKEIRDLAGEVEAKWKTAHGSFPKDQEELLKGRDGKPAGLGKMPNDPWGRPFSYGLDGETPRFSSAGPDEKDPADDVGVEDVRELQTVEALHTVATGLVEWYRATKAFPDALSRLTTVPESTAGTRTLPPLSEVPKDPWGKDLVYEAPPAPPTPPPAPPAGEPPPAPGDAPKAAASPVLLSTGPDGTRGTADDLAAELSPGKVVVRPGPRLSRFVRADRKDAWGHPVDVRLRSADSWTFRVASPGPDGTFGTEDDLEGNENELRAFFETVASEFELEPRRTFEAIYVHFPRVPDAILRAAWDRFPAYRPKEEGPNDPYARFKNLEGFYYLATTTQDGKRVELDPADPEKGHGADLVPDGQKGWLVPGDEAFGEGYVKDPPARPDDPTFRLYVEKGWRRILLREQFFEAMLNDWLAKARDSAQEHETWVANNKEGPEPERKTFETLLASVSDLQPAASDHEAGARFLEHFRTEKPTTQAEWEALPSIGDLQISNALKQLPKDDSYARLPTVIKSSAARAIVRGISSEPRREQRLDEPGVREKVWPRYVRARAMELAKEELRRVRRALPDGGSIVDATRAAAEARKFEWFHGTTGLFVGSEIPAPLRVPESMPPEEKAALARTRFAKLEGYASVRPLARETTSATEVGTVSRVPLADLEGEDATGAAYLVQVRAREDAPKAEFSAREYAESLDPGRLPPSAYRLGGARRPPAGALERQVARHYLDFARLRAVFDLKTKGPPPQARSAAR